MAESAEIPGVSVVIPTYRGADHLGGAIGSVLEQTYGAWELIVVDDASPDDVGQVVRGFRDPRLKYIRHDRNRGANAARNTGIRAARANLIAFLDQDDLFHPEKLAAHVARAEQQPEIGLTYGPRFELNHGSNTVRDIWCPPETLDLADLVLGFPMSPSDMVVRRCWLEKVGLWDDSHDFHGGEIILTGRLHLEGCRFSFVPQVLNDRRYHAGRTFRDIPRNCRSEIEAQEKILADPRCPPEVVALRDVAFTNTFLVWAYEALNQGESAVGQEYLRQAVHLNGALIEGRPCPLVDALTLRSVEDESRDHEHGLRHLFAQLPPEWRELQDQREWAVARGYLTKGCRAILWGRVDEGRTSLARARVRGGKMDAAFEAKLAHQILVRDLAFGADSGREVLGRLAPELASLGDPGSVRRLEALYLVNSAFRNDRLGEHAEVRRQVVRALADDPRFLANRGVLAILWRSIRRGNSRRDVGRGRR